MLDIFMFCFYAFEVCSIDPSKLIGKFREVFNFNHLFHLQLTTGSSQAKDEKLHDHVGIWNRLIF